MKLTTFEELEELGVLRGQRELLAQRLRARLGSRRAAKYVRRLKHREDLKTISSLARRVARPAQADEALLEELERRLPPARRAAPAQRTSRARRQPSR